ncbi:MAG: hypothetical protein PHI15_09885 [Methanomicrobium sp.]|nr:hypothetical protein [Methanomicrobium sp.]
MQSENISEIDRLKQSMSIIQKVGIKKTLLIVIAYVWTLFLFSISVISFTAWLSNADIYSLSFLAVSSVLFAVVTSIDLYLLYTGKYSFVVALWLIPIVIILAFKAVISKMNQIPFNPTTLPLRVRKYIFLNEFMN